VSDAAASHPRWRNDVIRVNVFPRQIGDESARFHFPQRLAVLGSILSRMASVLSLTSSACKLDVFRAGGGAFTYIIPLSSKNNPRMPDGRRRQRASPVERSNAVSTAWSKYKRVAALDARALAYCVLPRRKRLRQKGSAKTAGALHERVSERGLPQFLVCCQKR